jgi:hypothetical protein
LDGDEAKKSDEAGSYSDSDFGMHHDTTSLEWLRSSSVNKKAARIEAAESCLKKEWMRRRDP